MGDAKAKFFARMYAKMQDEEDEDGNSSTSDIEIDIGVTESGRTMILGQNSDEEDGTLGDMDFSVTGSGRIGAGGGVDMKSERSIQTIGTIGSAEMAAVTERSLNDTFQTNTERSMQTVATVGTIETIGTAAGSVSSSIMDTTNGNRSLDADMKRLGTTTRSSTRRGGNVNKYDEDDEDDDDSVGARISAPATVIKFHPLQPLPENTPPLIKQMQERSAPSHMHVSTPQPIPNNGDQQQQNHNAQPPSAASSAGSTGSGFINNIMNPVENPTSFPSKSFTTTTAGMTGANQMSHTPPSNVLTSYETSHFGKRARAGSLSERLLVSSELEEKGIINRDQKGILKDLIISGQDNELQRALDRYEQGDSTMLEGMLHSGTLASTEEIDLLGNLDFDFLNVKEEGSSAKTNSHTNIGNDPQQQQQYQISSYQTSDGIGELDFDGGIGNWEQQQQPQHHQPVNVNVTNADNSRSRSNSTWSQMEHLMQQHQRPRSNSTMSIDLDNFRSRSNSLFSSLIGTQVQESPVELGRWMESSSSGGAGQHQPQSHQFPAPFHLHHQQPPLAPLPEDEATLEEEEEKSKKPNKAARRASAPGSTRAPKSPSASAVAREQLKEQKRLERILRKEQKEREKQDKKEKREIAKLEKQKKKEELDHQEKDKERDEHIPGSGRPRSMSDPNIKTEVGEDGLLHVERPDGWIGAYSPESRKVRIARFLEKRNHRVWTKTVKYDVRKNFADSRLRVKGRFVKKEDELLMRELMSLT